MIVATVHHAEFLKSCTTPSEYPKDGLPEFACVGRSNVGKSSLINSMVHRHGLAKVSKTPGKTRLLNFFRVSLAGGRRRELYLVDLPGYGYAKVSRSMRTEWAPMIERYLMDRTELRGILFLLDSRNVQEQDRPTFAWLSGVSASVVIVATKIDKLTRAERDCSLRSIREVIGAPIDTPIVPYSAATGEGCRELWGWIETAMQEGVEAARTSLR
jgi:GTP-binding protein